MNTVLIIVLCASLFVVLALSVALAREQKHSRSLRKELTALRGQGEDELFSQGKFCELGLISAGITHEISNPLSVVLGQTTQLLRKELPDETRKDLLKIQSNAERIARIIRSVREYIYNNEEEFEDFIALRDIIDHVLVFVGQRLKNHGIELRLKNIDKVYLNGDKGQLEQAFLNLISNAFDAVDHLPEKWIEISAHLTTDQVQIYIRDSGKGIPTDIRSHMFEPFFTTKKKKGTGLGLALIQGVVRKHGGSMSYVDGPNTTFLLQFPQPTTDQYHN